MGDRSRLLELAHHAKVVSEIFHEGQIHAPLDRHEIAAVASFKLETVSKLLRYSFNPTRGRPIGDWLEEIIYKQLAYNVVIIVTNLGRDHPTIVYQQRQKLAEVIPLLGLEGFEEIWRPHNGATERSFRIQHNIFKGCSYIFRETPSKFA